MQTNIKTSFLSLVCVPILVSATTGSALAASTFKATPYFGADIGMQHFGFKHGYGDNLFKKSLNKNNVFLGIKFNDTFGIEGGYETTTNKTRNTTVYAGETLLGNYIPLPVNQGDVEYMKLASKARIFGWHLGVTANYPIERSNNNMAIIGYVGIKRAKVNILRNMITSKEYLNPVEMPIDTTINLNVRKYIVKLAGGMEYFLTKHIGIRALIGWENTAKLKTNYTSYDYDTNAPITKTARIKNSFSYGIGIVIRTP